MDKYEIIFAIDIGLHGGIAMFDVDEKDHPSHGLLRLIEMPITEHEKDGKISNVIDLPRLKYLLEVPKFHEDSKVLVVFENIHAFPGQGSVSTGTLMEQKGIIRGITVGLGYDEMQVNPRTWQKEFEIIPPKELKGSTGKKTKILRKKWIKEKSISVAKEKFPDWAEQIGKNDGLSDCLLIGNYHLTLKTL